MTRTILTLFLIATCEVFGQTPAAFEAASVKANVTHETDGEGRPRGYIKPSPGSLRVQNSTLSQCIQWAYNMQASQISGPSWVDSERFDIIARATGPASDDQLRLMLRALLNERFHLIFHRDTKELSGYALVVAKGGPKLHEPTTAEGDPVRRQNGPIVTFERMSISQFALSLAQPAGSPVVDLTGITGRYDFAFDLSKYMTPETAPDRMFDALSECLQQEHGLRIEARKLPMEVIVVEQGDKSPVEN